MKITIMSFDQALNCLPNSSEKCCMIRILEPNDNQEKLKHERCFEDILEVFFDDLVESPHLPSNVRLFNQNDAKQILAFFKKNKGTDSLIIHCHAGVSRSPAVALAFTWFLGDEALEKAVLESGKYVPNPMVMRILAEEIGVFEEKKEFIENYTDNLFLDEEFIW